MGPTGTNKPIFNILGNLSFFYDHKTPKKTLSIVVATTDEGF